MKLQSNGTTTQPATRQYRVLLVEDSNDMVRLMQTYLQDPRIQITVSNNGEQGLREFQSSVFDLVLMDIQMPILDGCAATLAIRRWEVDHSLPATTITALTASSTSTELARIFASGCSNYMPKPVTKTILLQMVKQYLNSPPKSAARDLAA